MSKAGLDLGDFTIAAKSSVKPVSPTEPELPAEQIGQEESGPLTEAEVDDAPVILEKRSPAERDKRARDRAVAQEDARASLKSLKRAKQREIKFYVNVALDQATKARLKKAADENDIKMATVMKAAIDYYLKENGY